MKMTELKNSEIFLQKFDQVLHLLENLGNTGNKSETELSEDVSYLLEKALDLLKDSQNIHSFSELYERDVVKKYLSDTLRVSRVTSIPPEILIFSIRLADVLLNDENKLKRSQEKLPYLLPSMLQLVETSVVENHEVKLALLKFLSMLGMLPSGKCHLNVRHVEFCITCLSDSTLFTIKAAKECLNTLLLSHENNKDEFINFFGYVTALAGKDTHILSHILEVIQNVFENAKHPKSIVETFYETEFDSTLLQLLSLAENDRLLPVISVLLSTLYSKSTIRLSSAECKEKLLKTLQILVNRGYLKAVFQTVARSLSFWLESVENFLEFNMELLYILLIPVHADTKEVEVYYDNYKPHLEMWLGYTSPAVQTLNDVLNTMVARSSILDELTSISVSCFIKTKNRVGKEIALKLTRSLLFLLGCLKYPQLKRSSTLQRSPHLVINLIESLCGFITAYDIKWWETPETTCLPIAITKLMKNNSDVNQRVACAALKGLRFCVSQFLHPNQALLLNSVHNSSMEELAEVVYRCCHSLHWEIRDSAMEVVLEMSQLSSSRFPAFQQLLLDSGLMKAAVQSCRDSESYVRASSLLCVAAMAECPSLKEQLFQETDVVADIIHVMQHDTEAIARRAATRALTQLYKLSNFRSKEDEQRIVETMRYAAVSDLDWEVKLESLKFWHLVIRKLLTEQGMIDGTFPEVSFSLEKQKIVRLDSKEIRKRLQHVLVQLSTMGCLCVLLQAADDCDSSVRESSLRILVEMKNILGKYDALDLQLFPAESAKRQKIPEIATNQSSPLSNESIPSNVDPVIEEIVQENDLNLVSRIVTGIDGHQELLKDSRRILQMSAGQFVAEISAMEMPQLLEETSHSSDLHAMDLRNLLEDLEDCVLTGDEKPMPDCY